MMEGDWVWEIIGNLVASTYLQDKQFEREEQSSQDLRSREGI